MVGRSDVVDLGNPGPTEKRIGHADAVAHDDTDWNGDGLALAFPGESPVRERVFIAAAGNDCAVLPQLRWMSRPAVALEIGWGCAGYDRCPSKRLGHQT